MSSNSVCHLLLPGAGGDAWYWHLVVRCLRALGHDVVAPDLPGDDDAAGLGDYADVAAAAVGDRRGVTVVAQSMGAFTAPLLCDRIDVARLILVAPMIPAPGETGGGWWESSGQLAAQRAQDLRDGRDPDAPFDVRTVFLHDVPEPIVEELFARGDRPQSGTPFREPWPLDAWPDVPTAVIAGRRDRLLPFDFLRALARERLGVEVAAVDSGHLPALARPDELVERIETARAATGA